MHHMTANWCPIGREERDMLCFGVWAVVGSTGRWPQTVNMWELNGWEGLVANFEHELQGSGAQDPSLVEWWAEAANFRRGGEDRIVIPEPWSPTIEELTDEGPKFECYAHELVTLPVGGARAYLDALQESGVPAMEAQGARCIGAFKVAMRNDTEAVVIWAIPTLRQWGELEQVWDGHEFAAWRARLTAMNADVQRILMVDSPLNPLKTGRQPQIEDRQPADQL
jgi:hypothetical protein